jgi:hypothetical protein
LGVLFYYLTWFFKNNKNIQQRLYFYKKMV